ncbi:hypothetical protein A2960_04695 [Candidatus Gottesmanbacteria bacterium RIFCSPLOWO2_01_FULL_39_12b]|uniref:Nif3-like dinuclear metal center hexameric protein n=1 Tax=Candidatus Gottesmanbacteria bacterium RIFCSPLOWO2_01_FULL_39_12b TaxID=1798388 RepID=A0A1F6APM8_9BACT|nr:MAG: hypothetical protein A2960_04695 [Candidatus Gottesmanbacteria bacterium RIFCSPLOWO2_01_FULL_39_12b]
MIRLEELNKYLNKLLIYDRKLDLARIDPYMTNGLMVKGREEVRKIGFGVSASVALFEKALDAKCEALIVHHSFNMPAYNQYDEIFQNRIGFLVKNDISLFGFHFLLDAHPEVGNNVQILKTVGANPVSGYFHRGNPWGWIGELPNKNELSSIEGKLKSYMSSRLITYRFGPQSVKKVVAISGKGSPIASDMQFLIDEKIDLYITGEAHEWNREMFREAKINFIAGGHYATEVFGIRALMEKVKTHFPEVTVEWLELKNDV